MQVLCDKNCCNFFQTLGSFDIFTYDIPHIAEVVELVDTQVSGTCGGNSVEVRVLFSAPTHNNSMQLIQNRNTGDYIIQSYTLGEIRINGVSYTNSLILSPHQIITDWPPQNIHALAIEHLDIIIQLHPEIIVLGTGEHQHFLNPILLTNLMAHHIGFEIMNTFAACRTFNLLASEGRKVVAGLLQ